MPRPSLDVVLRYLKPYSGFGGIQILLPSLPGEFPTIGELKKRFIQRSKDIPYSDRSSKGMTLHDRLQSLGVFDDIFIDSVVEDIHIVLQVFEIENRQRALKDKHYTAHDFSVQFHRSLLVAIFQHVQQLRKLLHHHEVEERHIAPYLKAAHRQMLLEVRAILPRYPIGDGEYQPATMDQSCDDMTLTVYDVFFQALEAAGVNRGGAQLAKQLTVVVCQSSSEAVRTKVERARHRLPRFSFLSARTPKSS
jgi:hypothetical protein